MNKHTLKVAPQAFAALIALSGCLETTMPGRLEVETGRAYTRSHASPVLLSNAAWWQAMNDTVLNALVAEALKTNRGLAAARARSEAAQASVNLVDPSVQVTGALDGRFSQGGVVQIGAAASLDWLLDPWGGRKARLRAALAEAEAAEAERAAAELAVLLDLNTSYIELRYLQEVIDLRRHARARQVETLTFFEQLEAAGEATQLDLLRFRTQIAEIDTELPNVEAAVAARRSGIASLTGQSAAQAAPLPPRNQPVPNISPQIGIPVDLLRNRPDIRAAELVYAAAVARIDVARAARYPTLSLGGTIGLDITNGSVDRRAIFGPSLSLPTLPGGTARAELARRHALAAAAHAEWQALVLEAIAEVESALASWRAAGESRKSAVLAVRLAREARTATTELVKGGVTRLTDLTAIEDQLADAELRLAEADRDVALRFVALNIQLGVGHGVSIHRST